tara:strand:+ start:219 stop:629 length:411 start_codon:yes stop_codon:yes gene_type:complete
MELNIRRLEDSDWDTLVSWWDAWPDWVALPRDFLPDNGKGGFMVEKNNIPIVAGFLYTTNSKVVLLEWIISNPDYKEIDRQNAIELLINGAENVSKASGYKYMFSIVRNKHLIATHKKLKWKVDSKSSHELVKIIN